MLVSLPWVRGQTFFKVVFFLPVVTSLVAVGYVWKWMLDPSYGVINAALGLAGIRPGPRWLSDPGLALWSLVAVNVWKWIGYFQVIFLANLQAIDPHYYEAAAIDGAGPWRRFLRITLPLLRAAIILSVILAVVNFLKAFALVFVMTQGGPCRPHRAPGDLRVPGGLRDRAVPVRLLGGGLGRAVRDDHGLHRGVQSRRAGRRGGPVRRRRLRWTDVAARSAVYLTLGTAAVAMAFPFYWMVVTTLRPEAEVYSVALTLWPSRASLATYWKLLSDPQLPVDPVLPEQPDHRGRRDGGQRRDRRRWPRSP